MQEIFVSPANDIDTLCNVAITELKACGMAKSGEALVLMAGSSSGGTAITDTVRMIIVP